MQAFGCSPSLRSPCPSFILILLPFVIIIVFHHTIQLATRLRRGQSIDAPLHTFQLAASLCTIHLLATYFVIRAQVSPDLHTSLSSNALLDLASTAGQSIWIQNRSFVINRYSPQDFNESLRPSSGVALRTSVPPSPRETTAYTILVCTPWS